jgi:transposase
MLAEIVWPAETGIGIDAICLDEDALVIAAHGTQMTACCPSCGSESSRINSYYCRHPADLPCGGYAIRLELVVPRFFCDNEACDRRTFGATFPAFVAPYARSTDRLLERKRQVGFAVSAEQGARLLSCLGMATSADTLIRLVRGTPEPALETTRVLGVDDWAKHKGQTYGTILVDLDKHRVIDLLDDRSAESLARWLQEHPGIEIIGRDRANEYAEGASRGAPDAIQVADRFHLLQNVREVLQRLLERHQAALRAATADCVPVESPASTPASNATEVEFSADPPSSVGVETLDATPARPPARPTKAEQQREARAAQRLARFHQVRELHAAGVSSRQIARDLGMSTNTVRTYVAADQFPQRATQRTVPSKLDPFVPYLRQQLEAGEDNAMHLWRTLRDHQGYTGSRPLVSRWVAAHRYLCPKTSPQSPKPRRSGRPPLSDPPKPKAHVLSARQAAWLLVRCPEDLDDKAHQWVERLCACSQEVRTAYALAQEFIRMVKQRTAVCFDGWLLRTETDGVPEMKSFAAGLRRDYAAVVAALSLDISNGQVEGQVNRLKLIKRTMYGRANFDLLRKHVLATPMAA